MAAAFKEDEYEETVSIAHDQLGGYLISSFNCMSGEEDHRAASSMKKAMAFVRAEFGDVRWVTKEPHYRYGSVLSSKIESYEDEEDDS